MMWRRCWVLGVLAVGWCGKAWAMPPAERHATVHFESEPENLGLLRYAPGAPLTVENRYYRKYGYDWLCGGSCELQLRPGEHRFAVTASNSDIVGDSTVSLPPGESVLRARYRRNRGSRVLGWVLMGTSPVTTYASLMIMKGANGGEAVSSGQVALGLGLGSAQLLTGLIVLVAARDSASFSVVPMSAPALPLSQSGRRELASHTPSGLSLQLVF